MDKKKIHLMTKLALYDDARGEKDKKINRYFKSDYIGKNLLFNDFILLCFLAIGVAVKFLNFVMVNNEAWNLDSLKNMGISYIVWSVIIVILYSVYNIYVYNNLYDDARRSLNSYYRALDKLDNYEGLK